MKTITERLDEKTDKLSATTFYGGSRCWLWKGAPDAKFGYGQISIGNKTYLAHRVAWMAMFGPIPTGKQVMHKCDVAACVNPNHLQIGTAADNMADMRMKGRQRHAYGMDYPHTKLTPSMVQRIIASPLSGSELAKQYEVAPGTISDIRNGHQQQRASGAVKKERKLNMASKQAREIFLAPGSQKDIAEKYGVSRALVSMIKSGKRWAGATLEEA